MDVRNSPKKISCIIFCLIWIFQIIIKSMAKVSSTFEEYFKKSTSRGAFRTSSTTIGIVAPHPRPSTTQITPKITSFRSLSTTLTTADVDQVPDEVKPNIVAGSYDSVEHYLDIHFRLLREDLVRPVREAVAWCRSSPVNGNTSFYVYHDIKGFERCYDVFGKSYKLAIPTAKNIRWNTTKRLKHGNFVCLSHDNFHTVVFAVIDQRFSPEPGTCILRIKLETGDTCNLDLDFSKTYSLVETGVFYEAYGHVLKVLKEFNSSNFPFPHFIVSLNKTCRRPKYLPNSVNVSVPEVIKKDFHQAEAFQHALTSDLAIIQGPPGTGKTFLSLRLVETLLQQGVRVLVVCYTNHALDQFLEGTLEFTTKLVRIGSRSKSAKVEPHVLNNIRKAITEWKKKNRNESSLLTGVGERSRILKQSCKIALSLIRIIPKNSTGVMIRELNAVTAQLRSNSTELDTLEFQPLLSMKLQSYLFSESFRIFSLGSGRPMKNETLTEFLRFERNKLHLYEKYAVFKDKLAESKRAASKLQKQNSFQEESSDSDSSDDISRSNSLESLNTLNDACEGLNSSFNQDMQDITAKCEKLKISTWNTSEKENMKMILPKPTLLNIFAEKLFAMEDQMTTSEARAVRDIWKLSLVDRWRLCRYCRSHLIEELKIRLKKMEEIYYEKVAAFHGFLCTYNYEIIRNADVIGMTTTGASKYRNLIELLKPQVVLVEEAAEVLEAHTIASIVPQTQHLILVGDHQQLRPNPADYDLAQNYDLGISLFERLVSNNIPYRRLEVQRRMRPCISQLLVPTIYPSLINDHTVLSYPDIIGMKDNMYFFSHNQEETLCDKSRSNLFEANFILQLCKYLLKQGYKRTDITVLTTYSGQKNLLSKLFKSFDSTGVRISTVDNFQGEENEIILLSFVRSNRAGRLGFLSVCNRVCVALSRARKGFYCFGNFQMLSKHSALWSSIVAKVGENKIGSRLLLSCVKHSNITAVVSPQDFTVSSRYGGCKLKCDYCYPCGHMCPMLCHPVDDHIMCERPCRKIVCILNHRCHNTCGEECSCECLDW